MASETEIASQPSTYELLIRLDERSNITNESLRAVKDEVSSMKTDVRNTQNETRNEIIKYIDSQIKPIKDEVCILRDDVKILKEVRSGEKGVKEFVGWINLLVLLILAIMTFFK